METQVSATSYYDLPLTERLLFAEQHADVFRRTMTPTLPQSVAMLAGQALGTMRAPVALPTMTADTNAASMLYAAMYNAPALQRAQQQAGATTGTLLGGTVAGVVGNLFGVSADTQGTIRGMGESRLGGMIGGFLNSAGGLDEIMGINMGKTSERMFNQRNALFNSDGVFVDPYNFERQSLVGDYAGALTDKFAQRMFTHADGQKSILANMAMTGGLSADQAATVMTAMAQSGSEFTDANGVGFKMRGQSSSMDDKLEKVSQFSTVMKSMMEVIGSSDIGDALNAMDQVTSGQTFNIDPARLQTMVNKLKDTATLYGTVPKLLFQGMAEMSRAYDSAMGNIDPVTGAVTNPGAGIGVALAASTESARIAHATGEDINIVRGRVQREMLVSTTSSGGRMLQVFGGLVADGVIPTEEYDRVMGIMENAQQDPRVLTETINAITEKYAGETASTLARDPEALRKANEALSKTPDLQTAITDTAMRAGRTQTAVDIGRRNRDRLNTMLRPYGPVGEIVPETDAQQVRVSAGRDWLADRVGEAESALAEDKENPILAAAAEEARTRLKTYDEAVAGGGDIRAIESRLTKSQRGRAMVAQLRDIGDVAVSERAVNALEASGKLAPDAAKRARLLVQANRVMSSTSSGDEAALRMSVTGAVAEMQLSKEKRGDTVFQAEDAEKALSANNGVLRRIIGKNEAGIELMDQLSADRRRGESDEEMQQRRQGAAAAIAIMTQESPYVDKQLLDMGAAGARQVTTDVLRQMGDVAKSAMTPEEREAERVRAKRLRELDVAAETAAEKMMYTGSQRLLGWAQGVTTSDGSKFTLMDVLGIRETDVTDEDTLEQLTEISADDLADMSQSDFAKMAGGMAPEAAEELKKTRQDLQKLHATPAKDDKKQRETAVRRLAELEAERFAQSTPGGGKAEEWAFASAARKRIDKSGDSTEELLRKVKAAEEEKAKAAKKEGDKSDEIRGTLTIIQGRERHTATLEGSMSP